MSLDPEFVEPGRLQGEDAPPSANQRRTEPVPPTEGHGVPSSSSPGSAGSSAGVPVPSDDAAEGTSESQAPVEGVRVTAIAPQGLADGEPDNPAAPTETF